MAIAAGAGFVARSFAGDAGHVAEMIQLGVRHRGFALIDILQPCVTFNRVNTFDWYRQRVYKLDKAYDTGDRMAAFAKAGEWGDRIPIGVIFEQVTSYVRRQSSRIKTWDFDETTAGGARCGQPYQRISVAEFRIS